MPPRQLTRGVGLSGHRASTAMLLLVVVLAALLDCPGGPAARCEAELINDASDDIQYTVGELETEVVKTDGHAVFPLVIHNDLVFVK